jgi:16S rRNA (guanine527-N7)-methyltransferase
MLDLNQSLNLTRWIQPESFLTHHLLDSAFALPVLKPLVQGPQKWMDLGSGCGFPGAVLIAAFPEVEVTLMDSVAKKTQALAQCLDEAGWFSKTLTGRAEEWGRDPRTRGLWDGLTARAVADFPVVLEYGIPLLKTGGYLVDWMTGDQWSKVDKAQKALDLLESRIIQKVEYSLPGLDQSRFIVIVEKMGITSDTYPRPVGRPSKKPL